MKLRSIFVVLLLSIGACLALFHQGFPPTHDGEYHIIRFYEFDKTFRSGSLYPRWAPDLNNGYGLPLFNYVYPLPNYISLIFHAIGISFLDAFKLNMAVASLLGAVSMYLWARSYWGEWGGIISSVFYTYAPYHFLDIYIRGSVGEVWALAFFPGFLWAATELIRNKNRVFLPITSLMLTFIIFSHNILSLIFFPFAVSYCILLVLKERVKKESFIHFFFAMLLGIGLAAIFWLPALYERGYVHGLEVFDYKGHFVELYQLIFPSWGSGFSGDDTTEGLSFQIGVAQLLALLILICFIFFKRKIQKRIYVAIFMFIWIFVSIFFTLPVSLLFWEKIPLITYFQFPWRFLSLIILCTSFLAGSLSQYIKSRILLGIFIIIPILLTLNYAKPAYYHMRDDNYYITRSNFIDGTNSPGNTFNTIWFNDGLTKATEKTITTDKETILNIAYFPSWQIFIDGEKVNAASNKDGLISIQRVNQNAKVEAKFLDSPIEAFGKFVSMISFFCIFLLLLHIGRARIAHKI